MLMKKIYLRFIPGLQIPLDIFCFRFAPKNGATAVLKANDVIFNLHDDKEEISRSEYVSGECFSYLVHTVVSIWARLCPHKARERNPNPGL